MSDTTTEVKAVLTAEDHASNIINSFRGNVDRLAKTMREFAFVKMPNNLSPADANPASANFRSELQAI